MLRVEVFIRKQSVQQSNGRGKEEAEGITLDERIQ